MKTFNRTNLPESVKYNGKEYLRNYSSAPYTSTKAELKKLIKVNVLSSKLKGKLDLHGKPYQPGVFYFKCN